MPVRRHFPSPVIPPDLAKKLPAKLPTSSLSQKKDTAAAGQSSMAKCQGDSEGLLFQIPNLVHQNKAIVTGLKDHVSPNVQQQIWSVGWKEYIDNQSSHPKKTHKTQIRSLSLKGGKATKFKSGSFCAKQSRTNSERDHYTVKPELLIRERATCM